MRRVAQSVEAVSVTESIKRLGLVPANQPKPSIDVLAALTLPSAVKQRSLYRQNACIRMPPGSGNIEVEYITHRFKRDLLMSVILFRSSLPIKFNTKIFSYRPGCQRGLKKKLTIKRPRFQERRRIWRLLNDAPSFVFLSVR